MNVGVNLALLPQVLAKMVSNPDSEIREFGWHILEKGWANGIWLDAIISISPTAEDLEEIFLLLENEALMDALSDFFGNEDGALVVLVA